MKTYMVSPITEGDHKKQQRTVRTGSTRFPLCYSPKFPEPHTIFPGRFCNTNNNNYYYIHLTAIFRGQPGKAAPER